MIETFHIKRGDTLPALGLALEPSGLSLAGATVRFRMRRRAGDMVLDRPALAMTVSGRASVEYGWQAGDTAEAGAFEAEFRVVYADGAIETFPNAGFIPVRIGEDVA
jgi:hypothetical protein